MTLTGKWHNVEACYKRITYKAVILNLYYDQHKIKYIRPGLIQSTGERNGRSAYIRDDDDDGHILLSQLQLLMLKLLLLQ